MKSLRLKLDKGLLAAWAIPSGIMLLLFILNGIFPFGDRSFLFSDMYHQYMPFFSEFVEKVRAGENLYYSWNVGVGTNFVALYAYYLASPLHWLAFLVPKVYLMEFMSYLVIVKIGLCGLTFCIYLRSHFQTTSIHTVLFACFYALSGYLAAYNWNIMWLDCVVLLPLILLGLEKLVQEGKCTLYCTMLALSILTNYYISIMICIFLVIYFIFLIFENEKFLRPILQFGFCSLLAGGLAAVILVPVACAMLGTDFGSSDFPTELKSYFSILDELARHCLCVTTERGLEHWPNIYCGVAVFLLVPLFVINPKISIKRRFTMLALAGILLLSFSTNILDFLWHGFNYPNSLPARQSFIYIWIVLVMCYEAFLHIKEVENRQILNCFLLAVAFLLFCEKFVENADFVVWVEVLTLVFLTLYTVLIYKYRNHEEKDWRLALGGLAFAIVMLEAGINMYNTSLGTVNRENYLKDISDYQTLYEYAQEEAEGFWRVEKFERTTKNDGTLAGYPTASVFSSTMNSGVADFYEKLGMRHSKVYYSFDGATGLTGALLNVQYMFGKTEDSLLDDALLANTLEKDVSAETNTLYSKVKESGNITLYECNYTLPFGYVLPYDYELPEIKTMEPIKLQNKIAESLGVQGKLFIKVDTHKEDGNIELTVGEEGYYYAILTASGTTKVDVLIDDATKSFKDLKNAGIIYVGYLQEGQTVTFTNGDEEDETQEISLSVYRMNTKVLGQVIDKLSAQHMTDVNYDSTHISGHISMSEAGKVVLSVPYEEGWTVMVNGTEVETGLFGDCFMTIALEPGEYDIAMEYVPKGLKAGMILSVICLVMFMGFVLLHRKIAKKEKVS